MTGTQAQKKAGKKASPSPAPIASQVEQKEEPALKEKRDDAKLQECIAGLRSRLLDTAPACEAELTLLLSEYQTIVEDVSKRLQVATKREAIATSLVASLRTKLSQTLTEDKDKDSAGTSGSETASTSASTFTNDSTSDSVAPASAEVEGPEAGKKLYNAEEKSSLEEKLKELEAQLARAQEEREMLERAAEANVLKLEDAVTRLEAAEAERSASNEALCALEQKLESAESRALAALEAAVEAKEAAKAAEIAAVAEELSNVRSKFEEEVATMRKEADEKAARMDSLIAEAEEKKTQQGVAAKAAEGERRESEEKQKELRSRLHDLEERVKELLTKEALADRLESECAELRTQNGALQGRAQTAETAVEASASSVRELTAKVEEAEAALKLRVEEARELSEKAATFEKRVSELEAQRASEAAAAEAAAVRASDEVATALARCEALKVSLARTEERLAAANAAEAAARAQIDEKAAESDALRTSLDEELRVALTKAELPVVLTSSGSSVIPQSASALAVRLRQALLQSARVAQQHLVERNATHAKYLQLEAEMGKKGEEVQAAEARLRSECEDRCDHYENVLSNMKQAVARMEKQKLKDETEVEVLKATHKALIKKVDTLTLRLQAADQKNGTLQDTLEKSTAQQNVLIRDFEELKKLELQKSNKSFLSSM